MIKNIKQMSAQTLSLRLAEAKREARNLEADIRALSDALIAIGGEYENDLAKVTVSQGYKRTDLDGKAVKADFPDWESRYGKIVDVKPSVRVTFK